MRRTSTTLLSAVLVAALGAAAPTAAHADPRAPRTERASVTADGTQADGPSDTAAISGDGQHVAFLSRAPALGCGGYFACLRFKNLATGAVTGVGQDGYWWGSALLSHDGSRAAYAVGRRYPSPYLYDATTGTSEVLWPKDPPGFNEMGAVGSLSPDGTHVTYTLGNRDGDQNTRLLYVRDTATGTDELISPPEEGPKAGSSVSGDGTRVAYQLRRGGSADQADVFLKDRATGGRTQVDTGLGTASLIRITANGRRVLFNADGGLYAHTPGTGATERVAAEPALSASANGRYAVLAGGDGPVLLDLRTGARTPAGPADAQVGRAGVAANGRAVAFSSAAPDLVPDDTNGQPDVFVRHTR
ncbi:TolB family protein [Streptomyces sp. NPDC059063]|uniref:TolB family protein n=1 Tax=unclassified Streptomyces TaxID=2593676 RepID=UPI0036842705